MQGVHFLKGGNMLISKEQMQKQIKKFYEKQKYNYDKKQLICPICGKQIKEDADPDKIEYVKTRRGDEFYYHRKCILREGKR